MLHSIFTLSICVFKLKKKINRKIKKKEYFLLTRCSLKTIWIIISLVEHFFNVSELRKWICNDSFFPVVDFCNIQIHSL